MATSLITAQEAAKRMSVQEETVKRWLRSGELKGYKMARRWKIDPADIDQFIQQYSNQEESPAS